VANFQTCSHRGVWSAVAKARPNCQAAQVAPHGLKPKGKRMMNRHMKRKMRALGLAAAMMTISATMAAAAITSDEVITAYQAEGYTRIEVKVGITQLKVEAIKGDVKVETIYDIETGDVIKTETEAVRAGENTAPGVSVRERNRDFVDRGDDDEDDDDSDDDNDDDDNDDDDDDDDNDDHGGDNDDDEDDDDRDEDEDDDDDDDDDDNSGSGSSSSGSSDDCD
jgi:hypothetical protein